MLKTVEVAPRGLWEMWKYKPSNKASQIKCPVQICVGEYDREVTGESTEELVAKISNCELKSYPINHFEIYRPDIREQVFSDQISFLRKHLLHTLNQ